MSEFRLEPPENPDNGENSEEGYSVEPLSPTEKKYPPRKMLLPSPRVYSSEPPRKRPFQYTLADLFGLTTAVAALMSVIMSLILIGMAPNTFAGITGLGAFISLILLLVWPPEQPLLRIGWWVLFVLYLLACIGVVVFGR